MVERRVSAEPPVAILILAGGEATRLPGEADSSRGDLPLVSGMWTVGKESSAHDRSGGAIVYRFRASDLHLILGPGSNEKAMRFHVKVDGVAPGAKHGAHTDPAGRGLVDGQRLYRLVRQNGVRGRTFEIEFSGPGTGVFVHLRITSGRIELRSQLHRLRRTRVASSA